MSGMGKSATERPVRRGDAPRRPVLNDQLIGGIGAGALSTLLLHPLDLMKTRFQGTCLPVPSCAMAWRMHDGLRGWLVSA